jgi:hypothetical protein
MHLFDKVNLAIKVKCAHCASRGLYLYVIVSYLTHMWPLVLCVYLLTNMINVEGVMHIVRILSVGYLCNRFAFEVHVSA